jgi:uncharacterized membrane protein
MRIERQVEIGVAPEEVFAFLADSENMTEWQSALDQVEQITPGPPRLGTTYRFASTDPPLESTVEWSEFEQGRRLAWHGEPARVGPGSIQFTGSHTIEALDGGGSTRLRSVFETRFRGALRLVALVRGHLIRRQIEEDLQRLKRVLEKQAAALLVLFAGFGEAPL